MDVLENLFKHSSTSTVMIIVMINMTQYSMPLYSTWNALFFSLNKSTALPLTFIGPLHETIKIRTWPWTIITINHPNQFDISGQSSMSPLRPLTVEPHVRRWTNPYQNCTNYKVGIHHMELYARELRYFSIFLSHRQFVSGSALLNCGKTNAKIETKNVNWSNHVNMFA